MPNWIRENNWGASALMVSALLLSPAIGCGPGDDDDTDGETPTPADSTPTPTATATPSEGGGAAFADGDFYFQSVFVFSFRTDPYILTIAGTASGADTGGDFAGDYIWVLWEDQDSYDTSDSADCLLYETMTGTASTVDAVDGVDYSTCVFCDPYSDFYSVYREDSGCSDDIFDWWYYDDETGDYAYEFSQVFGYRHTAKDGWPTEFADIGDALTANGWTGTIYDLLVVGTEFSANYIVTEVVAETAKQNIRHPSSLDPRIVKHIELESPAQVREYLKANPLK